MDSKTELTLDVQLITTDDYTKNYTILEGFLTNELYKLLPEIENTDLKWVDIKNRLGNELILNHYNTFKQKYIFSLCLNGLFVGGFTIYKLYTRFKK